MKRNGATVQPWKRQRIRNTSFRPNSSLRSEVLQHQGTYEVNRDIETSQRVDEVRPINGVKSLSEVHEDRNQSRVLVPFSRFNQQAECSNLFEQPRSLRKPACVAERARTGAVAPI